MEIVIQIVVTIIAYFALIFFSTTFFGLMMKHMSQS